MDEVPSYVVMACRLDVNLISCKIVLRLVGLDKENRRLERRKLLGRRLPKHQTAQNIIYSPENQKNDLI
jgi:hypothetical protein